MAACLEGNQLLSKQQFRHEAVNKPHWKPQNNNNIVAHCEAKKINVFQHLPVTFVLQLDSFYFSSEIEKFSSYFLNIEKALYSVRGHSDKQDLDKQ